jgi:predicted alpha/beta-fold hydrolase
MIDTIFGKIVSSGYQSPAWCKNRHVQTIWGKYGVRRAPIAWRLERFALPDNDYVELAWAPEPNQVKGVVTLFHGLEGSKDSHYIQDAVAAFADTDYQVVLMHFRGCHGEPNLTHRAYHSGETSDALVFAKALQTRFPNTPLFAVGFSLGGNMLMKLAGETGADCPFVSCVSVSAPLRLDQCADAIQQGFARVYEAKLLRSMQANLRAKMASMDYQGKVRVSAATVKNLDTFTKFDENVTAPLHGYAGADDYYQKCSGLQFLKSIQAPTLVLHALDDPFMNHNVVPKVQELSPNVAYELSRRGGHVGFLMGPPWRMGSWLQTRIPDFIEEQFLAYQDTVSHVPEAETTNGTAGESSL